MFVILVTIDCNSFDLDFPEVHVHVLLFNVFFYSGCYCFFGISYYLTSCRVYIIYLLWIHHLYLY